MSRSMSQTGPTSGTPPFMGDFRSRDHLVPAPAKLDPAAFLVTGGTKVVVGAAGAAAGAVAVPVAALAAAIPTGTVLDFGGAKFARLTADAAAGAVNLTVAALPTALVNNDTATYSPAGAKKYVPPGTVVGRTIAERDAAAGYGPAIATDPEAEIYITAFGVLDVADINDVELVRPGSTIYENRLPGISTMDATVLGILRTRYVMVRASE